MNNGEGIHWSLSRSGNNIYCGEYGQYPCRDLWKSTDDGATWSSIWTNPSSASVHIHGVIANPFNPDQLIFVTGDSVEGTYFSNDGGTTITQIISDSSLQMTNAIWKPPYIFLGCDNGTGDIYRDLISNFVANTPSLVKVFDASARSEGDFTAQVYTMSQDRQGRIYIAEFDEGNVNFGPGSLWVTCDDGVTWELIETYQKSAGVQAGPQQMSSALMNDKVFCFLGSVLGTKALNINPTYKF